MEIEFHKNHYINYAKFLQNLLLEKNIHCYLIGGSLINAVRDNGILKSDDIDFAVIADENYKSLEEILEIFRKNSPLFSYHINIGLLSIFFNLDKTKKIDFFLFGKRNINYYLKDLNYVHEKIYHFQIFRTTDVVLENKIFKTFYRPDLFLKTVYGDYSVEKSSYGSYESGDTCHMKDCYFFTSVDNYDNIDIQVENLKIFFANVNVIRDLSKIDNNKINIFDNYLKNHFDEYKNIFYSDFINFLIKNNIKYLQF